MSLTKLKLLCAICFARNSPKSSRIFFQAQIPSDSKMTNAESAAQKKLRNGNLYILRDGKTYNIQGQEMRENIY